jgi:hypothetical protein
MTDFIFVAWVLVSLAACTCWIVVAYRWIENERWKAVDESETAERLREEIRRWR